MRPSELSKYCYLRIYKVTKKQSKKQKINQEDKKKH